MMTPPVREIPKAVKSLVSNRLDAIRHTMNKIDITRKGTETLARPFFTELFSILVFISGYQAHSGTRRDGKSSDFGGAKIIKLQGKAKLFLTLRGKILKS